VPVVIADSRFKFIRVILTCRPVPKAAVTQPEAARRRNTRRPRPPPGPLPGPRDLGALCEPRTQHGRGGHVGSDPGPAANMKPYVSESSLNSDRRSPPECESAGTASPLARGDSESRRGGNLRVSGSLAS
jgi:hypothetical protein